MTKKYGLKCFGCGERFYSKDDVHRIKGKPYCGECTANSSSNDYEQYHEKKFYEQYPTDQDYIDEMNVRKYGEC